MNRDEDRQLVEEARGHLKREWPYTGGGLTWHYADRLADRLAAALAELDAARQENERLREALELLYGFHRGHIASPCPACLQAEAALSGARPGDTDEPA